MAVNIDSKDSSKGKPKKDTRRRSDAPYDFRRISPDPGIPGMAQTLAGKASDFARGYANTVNDVADFATGQDTEEATKLGNRFFGPDLSVLGKRMGSKGWSPFSDRVAKDEIADGEKRDLAYYLKQAESLMGGGTDYSALEQQLRNTHGENDARLEAMYRQLRGSIDADAPVIQQNYDEAGADLNKTADQAAANTNAGYEAARQSQADTFAKLGIGDAAAVLASQGNLAAMEQGGATAGIEQNRAANVNANTARKTSAVNYNTGIGNAAGLEGNLQRASNNQGLANRLAELQTQQSADSANRRSSSLSVAEGLRNWDASEQPQSLSVKDELANQETALRIAKMQQDLAANPTTMIGANLSQYVALAEQYGIDVSNQQALADFIDMVGNTQ